MAGTETPETDPTPAQPTRSQAGGRGSAAGSCAAEPFGQAIPTSRRVRWALLALVVGVVVAGFWNYQVVDAFGRETFAEPIAGDPAEAASQYDVRGAGFGVAFAVAAGLAATFTACNCVVFAMMPGLAKDAEGGADRRTLLHALGAFTGGVVLVGVCYGIFVGMLGPEGIEAFNDRAVRLAQAQAVFTILGLALLAWGLAEMGFLSGLHRRLAPETRAFLARPTTRAGAMGLLVGLFAVGRPFPVFREFLAYAATAGNPAYGAAVMAVHGVAMIAAMVGLLLAATHLAGDRMRAWIEGKPHGPRLLSGCALLAGGAYFVFYWGLSFAFDVGRWGWKLGLYG